MNALSAALYSALGGTAITALLAGGTATGKSSIYEMKARDNAPLDYVVFNIQGGGDANLTPRRLKNFVIYVRAYSKTSAKQAGLIDAQLDAALHNQTLAVAGWSNIWTAREQDIERVETLPSGESIWCAGGLYRIKLGA